MVTAKSFFLCFLCIIGSFFLNADDVKVVAEIDQTNITENQPITGLISITHDEKNKVDTGSFRLGEEPLKVELAQEIKMSSNNPLLLSIYKFTIDGKPKGLYILPPVSVKVGGKVYQSSASSYEVESSSPVKTFPPAASSPASKTPSAAPSRSSARGGSSNPSLKLEATVEGNLPLYPKQRARLIYRYLFQGNIALKKEILPLLDAEGMTKIGEKEIKDFTEGQYNIRQISQEVQAIKPGTYTYGPSIIEGYSYTEDELGHRTYSKKPITSEAAPVVITVVPFPDQGKPVSFNGAIGQFTITSSLLSASEMFVGDEISLSVNISGSGSLSSVALPDLCCQPGMSGLFRLSDLPPTGVVQGNVKTFNVKMRPLTATIREIPSFTFSYFDPAEKKYVNVQTKPIPIKVKPSATQLENNTQEIPAYSQTPDVDKEPIIPAPIEIEGNFVLQDSDLHNKLFGTWLAMLIVPIGLAAIVYQMMMKSQIERQKQLAKIKSAAVLMDEAFRQPGDDSTFFDLLEKALKQGLVEINALSSANISTEDMPKSGLAGEVRSFLSTIEERRFAGKGAMPTSSIRSQAQALFNKMKIKKVARGIFK